MKRYQAQLRLFFLHLDHHDLHLPSAFRDLDKIVAEYIDAMFQNGEPIGYAGDLLSGLSRWIPGSRGRLPTARLWFKNWNREVVRKRALPIPVTFLKGLAGLALAVKRVDLSALLLAGFLCMLRPSEIFGMRRQDVLFSPLGDSAIMPSTRQKPRGQTPRRRSFTTAWRWVPCRRPARDLVQEIVSTPAGCASSVKISGG